MSSADLIGFLVVLAAAAAVPGPDIAAIVARALSRGFVSTLPVIAGIVLGHATWLIAAATGLAALAQALGSAFIAVKVVGGIYLLYLAWQLWVAPITTESDENQVSLKNRREGLTTGLIVALSNPKAPIFFGAIVPSILPIEEATAVDLTAIVLASSVTLVLVFGVWAAISTQARFIFNSVVKRRTMNRASAVLLAGSGIAVAAR